ncbi:hypothetical protein CJ030_MR0G004692 [Morella rubra]|uniref:Uncharacterized protein n=1 Tax=Morella rubra TaxID=262757 RepID=A0A6A1ULU8_9ROSI|nr:hypothetical protein CJ030_MR0G004692 [Morella rubra]
MPPPANSIGTEVEAWAGKKMGRNAIKGQGSGYVFGSVDCYLFWLRESQLGKQLFSVMQPVCNHVNTQPDWDAERETIDIRGAYVPQHRFQ